MELNRFVKNALESGRTTLTEAESKTILGDFGVPVVAERIVATADEAVVTPILDRQFFSD